MPTKINVERQRPLTPPYHIDPANLSMTHMETEGPPTPEMTDASLPAEVPGKRKRKAWGQPVPEIVKIIGPRKRAKTAEERQQRSAERILRNRKAADKSRQRQKANFAKLETRSVRMATENASLREALLRYQSIFGPVSDIVIPEETIDSDDEDTENVKPESQQEAASILSANSPFPSEYTTDSPLVKPENLEITTTRFDGVPLASSSEDLNHISSLGEDMFSNPTPFTSMEHYSAEIMYGPQCPMPVIGTKLEKMFSRAKKYRCLSMMLQMIHYITIVSQTYCTSTLWPMFQMFQILEHTSQTHTTQSLFQALTKSFPLIHSLISMPSTTTRPAVFRLKLLSKLLTCSPNMSQLLLAATNGALEEVVRREDFAENPDCRWSFSSLMAIKWSIMRLEIEHKRMRQRGPSEGPGQCKNDFMDGVDVDGVLESRHLWDSGAEEDCNKMDEFPISQEAY